MSNIFISYNRVSEEIVRNLAADLESLGHDVWFDQDLSGGQPWWEKILETVRNCDLFIFALATESLESTACEREYQYAAELSKPILPVLVAKGVSPALLPPALAAIQIVEFLNPSDRDAALRLARAVASVPPPGPLPDPLPTPPEVPTSYLGTLSEKVKATPLNLEEQAALVFELKQAMRDPETAADARKLLKRLRKRRDLFESTAREVDELLSPPEKVTPPPPTDTTRTDHPGLGTTKPIAGGGQRQAPHKPPDEGSGKGTSPSPREDEDGIKRIGVKVTAVATLVLLAFIAYFAWQQTIDGRPATEAEPPAKEVVPAEPEVVQPVPDTTAPNLVYAGPSLDNSLPLGSIQLVGTVSDDAEVMVSVNGESATLAGDAWSHELDVTIELSEIRIEAKDSAGNQSDPLVYRVQASPSRFLDSLPTNTVAALWMASPTQFRRDLYRTPFGRLFRKSWDEMSAEWSRTIEQSRGRPGIGQAPRMNELFDNLEGEILVSLGPQSRTQGMPSFLIQAQLAGNPRIFEKQLDSLVSELIREIGLSASHQPSSAGSLFVFVRGEDKFHVVLQGSNIFASMDRDLAEDAARNFGRHRSDRFIERMRGLLRQRRVAGSTAVLLADTDRSFALMARLTNEAMDPWADLIGAYGGVADLGISMHRDRISLQMGLPADATSSGLLSLLQKEPFPLGGLPYVSRDADYYFTITGDLKKGVQVYLEFLDEIEKTPGKSQEALQEFIGLNHSRNSLLLALGDRAHVFGQLERGPESDSEFGVILNLLNPVSIESWLREEYAGHYVERILPAADAIAWDITRSRLVFGHTRLVREVARTLESGRTNSRAELDGLPSTVNAVGYANSNILDLFFSGMAEPGVFSAAIGHANWADDRYVIDMELQWD